MQTTAEYIAPPEAEEPPFYERRRRKNRPITDMLAFQHERRKLDGVREALRQAMNQRDALVDGPARGRARRRQDLNEKIRALEHAGLGLDASFKDDIDAIRTRGATSIERRGTYEERVGAGLCGLCGGDVDDEGMRHCPRCRSKRLPRGRT